MNILQHINLIQHPIAQNIQEDFELGYQLFGLPLGEAPVVLINHALTGNSQVAGKNGWWKNLVGHQQVVDLDHYTVIAFNIPGNGYPTDSNSTQLDYTLFTAKYIAELFWAGLDQLNIKKLYAIIGCSLGGGISWEMAFLRPTSITHLIPIATNLKASDWLIGNVLLQDKILNHSPNPIEHARIHAMMLYRSPASFQTKFDLQYKPDEAQYAVESWLNYHGSALKARFSLNAYKLMNHLLRTIGQDLTTDHIINFAQNTDIAIHCVAVDSDYLFTKDEQEAAYKLIKTHYQNIDFNQINSIHGHDAFLIEYKQLNSILAPIF